MRNIIFLLKIILIITKGTVVSMKVNKFVVFSILFLTSVNVFNNHSNADDDKKENNVKVALINMQVIEQKSTLSNNLKQNLKDKETQLQADLIKRKEQIENDYKNIEKNRAVLSRVELEKKAKQIESDMQKLQFDERKYSQIIEMSKIGSLNELQQKVQSAITDVAKDYDIVMSANDLLYYKKDKFTDLTDKLLEKINSKKYLNNNNINYEKIYKEAEKQLEEVIAQQKQQQKKKK